MAALLIALRTTVVTAIVTGLLYPLATTVLAEALFPDRAHGSLVRDAKGDVIGSELIGQPFVRDAYFQPRPSAAGAGFDALASGGSNLAPTSKKLVERVQADLARLQRANPAAPGPCPAELLLASGSGLDPDLSPQAAAWQIPRVAAARRVAEERVRRLLEANVEGRALMVLGEPRVNVLLLNLALDAQLGAPTPAAP